MVIEQYRVWYPKFTFKTCKFTFIHTRYARIIDLGDGTYDKVSMSATDVLVAKLKGAHLIDDNVTINLFPFALITTILVVLILLP